MDGILKTDNFFSNDFLPNLEIEGDTKKIDQKNFSRKKIIKVMDGKLKIEQILFQRLFAQNQK